jgi:peptide deformylase
MALEIRHYPDPVLLRRAREVTEQELRLGELDDGTKLSPLVDEMLALKHNLGGIGIAAPQVGVGVRLFVFSIREVLAAPRSNGEAMGVRERHVIAINPRVTPQGGGKRVEVEGCLSLPFVRGKVERPARVLLQYVDLEGKAQEMLAEGLTASVVQHEHDHCDGILMTSKLSSSSRFMQRKILDRLEGAYESNKKWQGRRKA